jgi:hypothetical protein
MVAIEGSKFGVWTMGIDGTNQKRVAEIAAPGWLSFTPDGRFIICTSSLQLTPVTGRSAAVIRGHSRGFS